MNSKSDLFWFNNFCITSLFVFIKCADAAVDNDEIVFAKAVLFMALYGFFNLFCYIQFDENTTYE